MLVMGPVSAVRYDNGRDVGTKERSLSGMIMIPRGTVDVSVDIDIFQPCRAGFHVRGMYSGSLGVSYVPADWRLRVFG